MLTATRIEAKIHRIYLDIDGMDRKVEIAVKVLARERVKAAQFRVWGEAMIVNIRHAAARMGV